MRPYFFAVILLSVALPAAADPSSTNYRVSGVVVGASGGAASGATSGRSVESGLGPASPGEGMSAGGLRVELGGILVPRPIGADTDGDGTPDASDNCSQLPNPDQRDTNADGYGNLCDPDLNGDGITNFVDLAAIKTVFFKRSPDADLNGDGVVNFVDLSLLKQRFFKPPGPSGLHP